MGTLTWKQREELIPNTKSTDTFDENEIKETFAAIKNIAIKEYELEGMTDSEIEETLFNVYKTYLENNKDELENIIFLDYADNFLNHIAEPLNEMLNNIKPGTEFKDNQHLFQTRYALSKLNQNITKDCFNKYFCSLENGTLFNYMTKEGKPLNEDFLEELKDKEDNLFEEPLQKDPKIRATHYVKEGNYNPKYWKGYLRFIEGQQKNLFEYFVANEKIDDVEAFRNIANIYYLYAKYYKLTNNLSNEKGKTI